VSTTESEGGIMLDDPNEERRVITPVKKTTRVAISSVAALVNRKYQIYILISFLCNLKYLKLTIKCYLINVD